MQAIKREIANDERASGGKILIRAGARCAKILIGSSKSESWPLTLLLNNLY
jgi:hypothetical protein